VAPTKKSQAKYGRIAPPYAMLNFVRAGASPTEVLLECAKYLESLGTVFLEWRVLSYDSNKFSRYLWKTVAEAELFLAGETNTKGVELDICSVVNPNLGNLERLSSLETRVPNAPGGTLTLSLSGNLFQLGWSEAKKREFKRIFDFLLECVQVFPVSYASLTVDFLLESISDLGEDSASYAFLDFYISESAITSKELSRIKDRFPPAAIIDSDHGLAVFSYGLDPTPRSLQISLLDSSVWVGRRLGKVLKNKSFVAFP
jgi:hypothetical protein